MNVIDAAHDELKARTFYTIYHYAWIRLAKISLFVWNRRLLHNNVSTAQELVDPMRIHYNFIRVNQAINQTPAEAAGINLNLGENKVEGLMRQAAVHAKGSQTEPLVKGLGIRINKVAIVNEKDCIKLKPKQWLDLKIWREINDIVRVQDFNWLANGKDSCWIRMQEKG